MTLHRTRAALAAALLLTTLAACADQPTSPTPPLRAPSSPSLAVEASPNGRYMVLATAAFPADFAARVTALGGTVESQHAASGFAVVGGLSATAATKLAAGSGIAVVEPDADVALTQPVAAVEADASDVANDVATSQANPATALRYVWQWNMRAIKANVAWAAGFLGDPGVTVAIIDTGLDYNINDLNGLVDLARSKSFVASDNAINATYFPSRNPVDDYNGHGTNVATQVSSKAFALAGVTSKTTLIGVKVLGRTGSGSFADVTNGILWAADHGADIANMSLGSTLVKNGSAAAQRLAITNRVFAYAKQQGMLIVVSAGNGAVDLDRNGNEFSNYCDAPHVVCVSSVGPAVAGQIGTPAQDTPAFYTNFGRSAIGVAGPGGNADAANGFPLSAWPWGNDIASWVWSYCPKFRIAGLTTAGVPVLTACFAGNRLIGFIGTSQAAPHVAGLAAQLAVSIGHGQPALLKAAVLKAVDDLGPPGVDPFYGRGRIDVAKGLGLP